MDVAIPLSTNTNQALWEKGDFTRIAAFMREAGTQVVEALAIESATRALDLGCGDGTTALPLARRGASVLGVDIARNLVTAGRQRAAEAGLTHLLHFEWGDACRMLDLPSCSFDLTLTMFGAMFAPNPMEVAREMVRVTKRGGRIVMGNWIANDSTSFVSQLLRICAAYGPPPPFGYVSPMTWGDQTQVVERFAGAGIEPGQITFQREQFVFRCPEGPEHLIETFRECYGPTMNAYAAAALAGRERELHRELLALAVAQARPTTSGIAITATYLRVTVQC